MEMLRNCSVCFVAKPDSRFAPRYKMCKDCQNIALRHRRCPSKHPPLVKPPLHNIPLERKCTKCQQTLSLASFSQHLDHNYRWNKSCDSCLADYRQRNKHKLELVEKGIRICSRCNKFLDKSLFYESDTRCKECKGQIVKDRWSSGLARYLAGEMPDEYCETKTCSKCKIQQPASAFYLCFLRRDWLTAECANCVYERKRQRRLTHPKRHKRSDSQIIRRHRMWVPKWANRKAIGLKYREAQRLTEETGVKYVCDHIDPILSPFICGLHVEENIAVITETDNLAKNNHFTPYTVNAEGNEQVVDLSVDEARALTITARKFLYNEIAQGTRTTKIRVPAFL